MISLVLDSGAYSCWKRQEDLHLGDYIDFIEKHQGVFSKVVNLDRIPGVWGTIPSPLVVKEAAKESWLNYKALDSAGINTMPVYHQGESINWLRKMIDDGCEWVGISPSNDRTTAQKIVWLDEIFSFLCGDHGYPVIKTHGFGVTALPILFRYPWYSVDSTTWLMVASYGGLFVPKNTPAGPDYSCRPEVVQVANRREGSEPSKMALQIGRHYQTMTDSERRYVLDFIESAGVTLEACADGFEARCCVCARFFMNMMDVLRTPKFHAPVRGFFPSDIEPLSGFETLDWERLRFIFTVPTSRPHSAALNSQGAYDRLITYYYFKDGQRFDFEYYVRTGEVAPIRKKRKPTKRARL